MPRSFLAADLPTGSGAGPGWARRRLGPGPDDPDIELLEPDAGRAGELLAALARAGEGLRALSSERLVQTLGRAGERFGDPADPLRAEAEELLPGEAALSPAMARLVLDRMAADWTTDALDTLLRAEFDDPAALEGFVPGPGGDRVRAVGDRFALHVCSGNVAGVGAMSMLRSLLVRSPLLLKPGRGDIVLPVLLARAIREVDPVVGNALAVVYWPGGTWASLASVALDEADRVVVYGGAEVMAAVESRVRPGTTLVRYRHRISVAALGREALGSERAARRRATEAAGAVSAYDQRGCVSPHLIWVEEGGAISPVEWAGYLAEALEACEEEWPAGPLEPEVAARIQQVRGEAELLSAGVEGARLWTGGGAGWTVFFEPEPRFEAGCTGRFVRVQPVVKLEELPQLLGERAEVLQSVGLEAGEARREALAGELARIGVSRTTTLERQPWPRPWWTHDGQGPLRSLVRWSTLEGR
jgi:hypothetical protein